MLTTDVEEYKKKLYKGYNGTTLTKPIWQNFLQMKTIAAYLKSFSK